jgi:catechol 2,3-dioxygenase-like lactoylglutathione lyase family enzyme
MIDHLSVQCADVRASAAFYDAVLRPLGFGRVMDSGEAIGYGLPPSPDFCIGQQRTGAEVLHEPRIWPEYHETYYGAFVRDPDGNNVEAVCHAPE